MEVPVLFVDLSRKEISFDFPAFCTGVKISGNWCDYTRRGMCFDIPMHCFLTLNMNFALCGLNLAHR